MKIRAVVRKRVLTKINSASLVKGKKQEKKEEYPVLLYCNDRGKVYYVTTGLTTTNPDMVGNIFTDKDASAIVNNAKSNRLAQMITESERYALDHHKESVEQIKKEIKRIVQGESVLESKYLVDHISEFVNDGKHSASTIVCYNQTINKVRAYDAKATLDSVDEKWLLGFVEFMEGSGMTTNGYAIPLRNIRAVFNWAKKRRLTSNYPFDNFGIKTARTRHTVLTAQDLADIRDYPCEPWQEKYRDYFMLMFYLCGIDIVDLCHIKEIKGGRVRFFRQKNECRENMVEVDLPITKDARSIINKYKGERYLLNAMDGRANYKSFVKSMNQALKKIGYQRLVEDKAGKMRKIEYYPIVHAVSTKTIRRTFATISRKIGIPEPVVGMCLGHSWAESNTTQIYEYFDREDMDNAINKIVSYLDGFKGRTKEEINQGIMEREGLNAS